MKLRLPLLLCLASASMGEAFAQRYLVVQTNPPAVHRVDVQAGAVFEYGWIDLAPNLPGQPNDVAPVGDQIWVAATGGVLRYDGTSLAYLGTLPITGPSANGVQPVPGGAWLARVNTLEKYDLAGNLVTSVPAAGSSDVFLHNGELLVTNQATDTIDRYSLAGQFLGPIGPAGLGSNIQFAGFGYLGLRPSTGNLLLAEIARILEVDPATGLLVGNYQAGLFEQSAVELEDERLLVFNVNGATTFDPNTQMAIPPLIPTSQNRQFGRASLLDVGHPDLRRFCASGSNSTGLGARIAARGTVQIADGSLWLDAFQGPPGELGLFVYGHPEAGAPFGNGVLCLSSQAPGVVRTNTVGAFDGAGSREAVELPYVSFPAAAPVSAGSAWAFQYTYRDTAAAMVGSSFNATDAIRLLFE